MTLQRYLSLQTAEIQELILQLIAFKNLITRNRVNERFQRQRRAQRTVSDPANAEVMGSSALKPPNNLDESVTTLIPQRLDRIPLPFLVVSTSKSTVIDCNISRDK